MHIDSGDYTRLVMKSQFKLENEQILIIASSGGGKTVAEEGIAEELHNLGYIVIVLTDFKDVIEYGFTMFEPEDPFHLKNLREINKKPSKKEAVLYHPFTTKIPRYQSLPDKFRFFTFSVKSLIREELALITETHSDTDTMRQMMDSVERMGKKDGILDFLHDFQDTIAGKSMKYRQSKIKEPDPHGFFLDKSTQATIKNVGEVASLFKPFNTHPMLMSDDFELNIDVEEEIFKHQEKYHILTTKWIPDEKIKAFVMLKFFNEIFIKSKGEKCKHPICFILDEIGNLTPYKALGYKLFLADALRPKLTTLRSGAGRGATSLMGSQVWWDIDEKVREKATQTLFGRLGGTADIGRIKKELLLSKDTVNKLSSLDIGRFLLKGHEEEGEFKIFFPSHMHKEEKYNFFEMYRKHYPKEMKKYTDLIKKVEAHIKDSEKKIKEKIMKKKKSKMDDIDVKDAEKKSKENAEEKLEKTKEKLDTANTMRKDEIKARCYELWKNSEPKLSYREIGKQVGIDHKTVKTNIEKVKKNMKLDTFKTEEKVEKVEQDEKKVAMDECPECGNKLILKHGKEGEYMGCKGCKFTRSV